MEVQLSTFYFQLLTFYFQLSTFNFLLSTLQTPLPKTIRFLIIPVGTVFTTTLAAVTSF